MPLRDLNRHYRHIQRYRKIAEIFMRNGFGYLLDKLDLHHFIPLKNRMYRWNCDYEPTQGQRLKKTLEELGPSFIKLGQMLSTRPDIIPKEVRSELERLQDGVKPIGIDLVQKVITEEMGQSMEEIFSEFSEKPLASASIGQVHLARLLSGEIVVVKVQRPGIEKMIKVDLEIMQNLAGIIKDRATLQGVFDLTEIVREFTKSFLNELDYQNEARNAERFRLNSKNQQNVQVPRIFWHYTTQRILTMEYIEGRKITEIVVNESEDVRKNLARTIANSFLSQVLEYGFFHGDPHPGNILITEAKKLVFLDFGLMGELDEKIRDQFADLFIGLIKKNTNAVVDTFLKLGMVKSNIDCLQFQREIGGMIEKYYGIELKDVQVGTLFEEVMEIGRKYNVHFPSDLVLLGKSAITFEGVGHTLDPSFNVVKVAQPFAYKLARKQMSPKRVWQKMIKGSGEFLNKTVVLPNDLHMVMEKILNDNLEIKFKHHNLENLTSKLDIVVNRLVVGLIVSALFVGSSLSIQAQIGPQFRGVSSIGFLGFIMAGILGIWLVIAILRSGRF